MLIGNTLFPAIRIIEMKKVELKSDRKGLICQKQIERFMLNFGKSLIRINWKKEKEEMRKCVKTFSSTKV